MTLKYKFQTHFISGDLYRDLISDNMYPPLLLDGPQVEEKSAILNERKVRDLNMPTAKKSTYRGNFGSLVYVLIRSGSTSFLENISHFFNNGSLMIKLINYKHKITLQNSHDLLHFNV